jgi:hypothetical protein
MRVPWRRRRNPVVRFAADAAVRILAVVWLARVLARGARASSR